jgi:hypothetical protein
MNDEMDKLEGTSGGFITTLYLNWLQGIFGSDNDFPD